ncbi:MAG TPA: hypothetical protein VI583_15030, partial [Cyclobacteriaceae bacterium]|nr:hypothetical protein [Cyclobacteriaceae bacterium]
EFFQIGKDGRVLKQESLNANLTGIAENRPNSTTEVGFEVEYPDDGKFVIYITELRDTIPTPQLTVELDGKPILQLEQQPLKTENYHPVMHNQFYAVPVPKGPHTIKVSNTGGGQITTSFELKNYIPRNGPDIEVRGIQCDDYMILWLKNQKYTVLHELAGIGSMTQPEGILTLQNVSDGTWLAEWLNTIDATPVKSELVECTKGNLVLHTPIVDQSIAVRLQKLE